MTAPVRRYPADRLAERLGLTLWQMFREIGVDGSVATTIRDKGFSEIQADRACTKLGLSAYDVWPELRDDILAEEGGLPDTRMVLALVQCLECGRPLTFGEPRVASDGSRGSALATCPGGHTNVLRVELEVA